MQFGAKKPALGKFRGKLKFVGYLQLSDGILLEICSVVCRKIATSCRPLLFEPIRGIYPLMDTPCNPPQFPSSV